MPFIPETIIDHIAAEIGDSQANHEVLLQAFQAQQPAIFAFLCSESFQLLTIDERDFLLYLSMVIWKSVEKGSEEVPLITQKALAEKEEENWEILNNIIGKNFRQRLDAFFEGYPQEDLLAFVEDSLTLEEEDVAEEIVLTKEGRDPIFIALKTVIDCLTY